MTTTTWQRQATTLTEDGSTISSGTAWTDVIAVPFTSTLYTSAQLKIEASLVCNRGLVAAGGQMRVVIDGGSYSDHELVGPIALPGVTVGCKQDWEGTFMPDAETSYAVKLQARTTLALDSITPQIGTSLIVDEWQ